MVYSLMTQKGSFSEKMQKSQNYEGWYYGSTRNSILELCVAILHGILYEHT